ncbi:MAG: hypothetical protein FWG75_06240 [Cystobacterineae bacterium]|nr:hypothetical protein [Cystobacterineae bacterium]
MPEKKHLSNPGEVNAVIQEVSPEDWVSERKVFHVALEKVEEREEPHVVEAQEVPAMEEVGEAVLMTPGLAAEGFPTDRFPAVQWLDDRLNEANALLEKATRMLELDNHSGAMELILKAAELVPEHPQILQLRLRTEATLLVMLESRLGNLEAIPFVKLRDEEILWLNLESKAGFVLGKMDGRTSLSHLLSLPEIPRLELARILVQLFEKGVIDIAR